MITLLTLLAAPVIKGAELKDALRVSARPESYLQQPAAAISRLTSTDGLTGETTKASPKPLASPAWVQLNPELKEALRSDLYNLRRTAVDNPGLPFAKVEEITTKYGNATRGYGSLSGQTIEAVEPADEMKGDVARTMMYIATVYSPILWCDWGGVIFDTARPLTMSEDIAAVYLAWHVADPVSEEERVLCDSIARLQGNENPFVTHPEYAGMIWGDNSGNPDTPEDPPVQPEVKPEPLKAIYSVTADPTIFLTHPTVDPEATWTIDGRKISSATIATSSLTRGRHELRFTSGSTKGKLIITIVE